DHTGRAIRRIFRPGFLRKVRRTSVASHYGIKTLLYGTLLPGPDIGAKCASILRMVRDEGFETGIHAWDHVGWQDGVNDAPDEWIARQVTNAAQRYQNIFGAAPKTHGAAGWQMPAAALRQLDQMGFDYCTDGRTQMRVAQAHYPVVRGEIFSCPQLPTNLPTMDELMGANGIGESNVHERILELTAGASLDSDSWRPNECHVFTLHAELEGQRLLPAFERLLAGWRSLGYELVSTRSLFEHQARNALPYFNTAAASVPGRSGTLMMATSQWPSGGQIQ
ncbi:MAG: 4-deoxy-4-formamido-L-arabinose-phosphoundecaprenol deformylase, partial [Betaproteobacteria bacterium]|nr:4-deoxy-4-formamido-L-arabinose-phosphoundecaprenol deformylase [Betaproteobacteria bacterium]